MKTRNVIGRKIVDVSQRRWWCHENGGYWIVQVRNIFLDNGTCLVLQATPTEDSPVVEIDTIKINTITVIKED